MRRKYKISGNTCCHEDKNDEYEKKFDILLTIASLPQRMKVKQMLLEDWEISGRGPGDNRITMKKVAAYTVVFQNGGCYSI